jgi:hypothetical protein
MIPVLGGSGALFALGRLVDPLFGLGVLVLAIGLGRAGSVTARRPLGTGAVIGLVLVMLVQPYVYAAFTPREDTMPAPGTSTPLQIVYPVVLCLMLMLAIIAVVQIARIGVIPRPWNAAPLWVLVVAAVARALPMAPFWSPMLGSGENVAPLFSIFDTLAVLQSLSVVFLGTVLVVLGSRAEPGSAVVYSSSAS